MSYVLRDYQQHCSDSIFKEFETHQSTLLSLFTGGGKTIIFADVIRRMRPGRAMVLANREELIFQAADKIHRSTGLNCAVEMAGMYAREDMFNSADVVVSTVQTQVSGKGKKRMHRFNPDEFSLLVVDEAHFAVSSTFRKAIEHYTQNKNLKHVGVTATPSRHDKEALSQIYESSAANFGMLDGIQGGWLCDITQQFISVAGLDYSHIDTTAGDLNGGQLSREMERQENIIGVCQPSLEVMFGLPPHTLRSIPVPEWGDYLLSIGRQARRSIVFTASVDQANMCAEIFNRVLQGIAASVDCKTPKEERRSLLKRFSLGEVRAIMNCGVLSHGFDDPGVEVIIMARPTKSRSLYEQMIGRSTRPLPGVVDGPDLGTPENRIAAIAASAKPFCRIIDFVGNSGVHRLITTADVLGGRVSEEAVEKAIQRTMENGKPVRMSKVLDKAECDLIDERQSKLDKIRNAESARRNHLVAGVDFSSKEVDLFGVLGITRSTPFSRDFHKKPTENQIKFLATRKIFCEQRSINKTDAGKMIGKIKEMEASLPATPAQRYTLRKFQMDPNTTRGNASRLIAAIEKNGWIKPEGLK